MGSQRNNNAPDIDKLPSELFKSGGEHLAMQMHGLIEKYCFWKGIPNDWKTEIICRIYKKGDKLHCENFITPNI